MRVGVQLVGAGLKTADAISTHLETKWDPAEVIVFRDALPEGELDGLLTIGGGQAAPTGVPLTDSIEVPPAAEGEEANVDELAFQIDAKLGRLTKSYLARQSTRSYLTQQSKFSRRDLIAGVRKGFRRYSGFPYVFNDSCEAKRGCTKCVDACPSRALRMEDGNVVLNDADCTMCGLCAAVCPVGAVQMPELSDAAFYGLLEEIDDSKATKKTLVLTCSSKAVGRRPWMLVEQVSSVGIVGPRMIAAAAASSLGAIAVVCPDGACIGKESALTAVEAIRGSVGGGPFAPLILFVEGKDESGALAGLHESSGARAPRGPRSGDKWKDYIEDLSAIIPLESPASGLGLSKMIVAKSCTLCSACVKACPHESLRLDDTHLFFSASTCTGCGLCVKTCPEHSIALAPASGKMLQVMGSERLFEDELVSCARCGKPIGSATFVGKISTLLGPDAKLVKYCPDCKKQEVIGALFGGREHG